jgi:uncharacterized protein (TIGR03435 family)
MYFAPIAAFSRPPEDRPDPDIPSFQYALQEQMGLKPEAITGPVNVLVIDSVRQPIED